MKTFILNSEHIMNAANADSVNGLHKVTHVPRSTLGRWLNRPQTVKHVSLRQLYKMLAAVHGDDLSDVKLLDVLKIVDEESDG
ncbi:MAG: hypothetical protein CUN54_09250 [Phototrophicales bacterium]|nr:MAG: hypothetical protein CUN54_09250 [Phototrophicales bacterium]